MRYAHLRTCVYLRVLALIRCEYDAHVSPRVIYVTCTHMTRVRHAGAPRRVRQVSQYDASKNTLTRSGKADTGVGTTAIPQHVSPHVSIYAMPWSLEIPSRNPSKFLGHGISIGHVSARHVYICAHHSSTHNDPHTSHGARVGSIQMRCSIGAT